jgi:hypothetical protein
MGRFREWISEDDDVRMAWSIVIGAVAWLVFVGWYFHQD